MTHLGSSIATPGCNSPRIENAIDREINRHPERVVAQKARNAAHVAATEHSRSTKRTVKRRLFLPHHRQRTRQQLDGEIEPGHAERADIPRDHSPAPIDRCDGGALIGELRPRHSVALDEQVRRARRDPAIDRRRRRHRYQFVEVAHRKIAPGCVCVCERRGESGATAVRWSILLFGRSCGSCAQSLAGSGSCRPEGLNRRAGWIVRPRIVVALLVALPPVSGSLTARRCVRHSRWRLMPPTTKSVGGRIRPMAADLGQLRGCRGSGQIWSRVRESNPVAQFTKLALCH